MLCRIVQMRHPLNSNKLYVFSLTLIAGRTNSYQYREHLDIGTSKEITELVEIQKNSKPDKAGICFSDEAIQTKLDFEYFALVSPSELKTQA